jgi:hypothetical protein
VHDRRGRAFAERDADDELEQHDHRRHQARRPGDQVARRELGHRDGERHPGQEDDERGDRDERRRDARPLRRYDARCERRDRRADELEHARLIGRSRGQLREHAEHEADRRGDRDVGCRASEEHRDRARGDAVNDSPRHAAELGRSGDDRVEPHDTLGGRDAMFDDVVGEAVDVRELAHIELASFDAHHPRAQLGRPAETEDERGRRGEHFGFEREAIADVLQAFFEAMRRRAVTMKRASEREHEADGRLVDRHASPPCPKMANARAATQAFASNQTRLCGRRRA